MKARRPVRLPDRPVWVDGRICRGGDATLSVFDRGARDGEGLLETLRVYGGRPFAWKRHMERLVLAAAELGFPVPPSPDRLARAVDELLAESELTDAAVRITVTRGVPGNRPTRTGSWVEAQPIEARLWSGTRTGKATAVFSRTPFHPGPLGRYKTTSRLAYALAGEEARAAHVDEALLVTLEDRVLEGATSNVFAVIDGSVVTPPLDEGILPGIARAVVLECCAALGIPAQERTLTREDLRDAEEAFLTNSLQEVAPLAAIEGRPLRSQAIGARLRAAYRGEAVPSAAV